MLKLKRPRKPPCLTQVVIIESRLHHILSDCKRRIYQRRPKVHHGEKRNEISLLLVAFHFEAVNKNDYRVSQNTGHHVQRQYDVVRNQTLCYLMVPFFHFIRNVRCYVVHFLESNISYRYKFTTNWNMSLYKHTEMLL